MIDKLDIDNFVNQTISDNKLIKIEYKNEEIRK